MPSQNPPALPAQLSRPDAQQVVDALNQRLWVQEQAFVNVKEQRFGAKGDGATDDSAVIETAAKAAEGGILFFPPGKYISTAELSGIDHLTIMASDGAVLHNATAGKDALSLVECDELTITGLRVQGTSGTRDGLHLENCQRARVGRILCQGSGRHGIYAQRCQGLVVDQPAIGIDNQSPFPEGVANCLSGLVLSWDGVAVDSGCNQFVLIGGFSVVGQSQDWAIQVIRAEGGTIIGPITELSKGGIKLENCGPLNVVGYYGEANPSDVEYHTGTCKVTAGSKVVTGAGTKWNTNDEQGHKNAMLGKWLIVGQKWGRVASIQSDTEITLESNWGGESEEGASYRLQSVDLYLKESHEITVHNGRGGGAVLVENSSNNHLELLTDTIFFDVESLGNEGRISTGRGGGGTSNRIVDWSGSNLPRIEQIDFVSKAIIRQCLGDVTKPTLENSWVDEGSGTWNAAGIWKDRQGVVHLRGAVKGGALGNGAFTLPVSWRPKKKLSFAVVTGTGFGRLDVFPTAEGFVVPITGGTELVILDGISFRVDS